MSVKTPKVCRTGHMSDDAMWSINLSPQRSLIQNSLYHDNASSASLFITTIMFITISEKVSSVRYTLLSLWELANKESVCLPDYKPPGVAEGMMSDIFHLSYGHCYPYCRHHDDIWTWKQFPHHYSCYGESTGIYPYKGVVMRSFMSSLCLAWRSCWTNNRVVGNLIRHDAKAISYDVIMLFWKGIRSYHSLLVFLDVDGLVPNMLQTIIWTNDYTPCVKPQNNNSNFEILQVQNSSTPSNVIYSSLWCF